MARGVVMLGLRGFHLIVAAAMVGFAIVLIVLLKRPVSLSLAAVFNGERFQLASMALFPWFSIPKETCLAYIH